MFLDAQLKEFEGMECSALFAACAPAFLAYLTNVPAFESDSYAEAIDRFLTAVEK